MVSKDLVVRAEEAFRQARYHWANEHVAWGLLQEHRASFIQSLRSHGEPYVAAIAEFDAFMEAHKTAYIAAWENKVKMEEIYEELLREFKGSKNP